MSTPKPTAYRSSIAGDSFVAADSRTPAQVVSSQATVPAGPETLQPHESSVAALDPSDVLDLFSAPTPTAAPAPTPPKKQVETFPYPDGLFHLVADKPLNPTYTQAEARAVWDEIKAARLKAVPKAVVFGAMLENLEMVCSAKVARAALGIANSTGRLYLRIYERYTHYDGPTTEVALGVNLSALTEGFALPIPLGWVDLTQKDIAWGRSEEVTGSHSKNKDTLGYWLGRLDEARFAATVQDPGVAVDTVAVLGNRMAMLIDHAITEMKDRGELVRSIELLIKQIRLCAERLHDLDRETCVALLTDLAGGAAEREYPPDPNLEARQEAARKAWDGIAADRFYEAQEQTTEGKRNRVVMAVASLTHPRSVKEIAADLGFSPGFVRRTLKGCPRWGIDSRYLMPGRWTHDATRPDPDEQIEIMEANNVDWERRKRRRGKR